MSHSPSPRGVKRETISKYLEQARGSGGVCGANRRGRPQQFQRLSRVPRGTITGSAHADGSPQ